MSACTPPEHAPLDSVSSRGVTPPLLPTLAMAAILGAASYLCHEPAAVAPPAPVSAAALATAVAAAPASVAEAPFIPASLAFQVQFPQTPVPMVAEADPARVAPAHRVARPARLAAARREAPRVATKAPQMAPEQIPAPDRPLPFVAESSFVAESPFAAEAQETTVASSEEGVLPALALPFAPTIRAVTQASAAAGAFVGAKGASLSAGTASLGAAVSGWMDGLR